jgi:CheY-like chemotaxis protein
MSSISENPLWGLGLERSTIFMVDSRGDTLIVRFRARPAQLAPTSGATPGMDGWHACATVTESGQRNRAATAISTGEDARATDGTRIADAAAIMDKRPSSGQS